MLFKILVALAAVQATCLAAPSRWGCPRMGAMTKTVDQLVTGQYYWFTGADERVCWKYSDESSASYLSVDCESGGIAHKVRFCSDTDCYNKESLVPGRRYYMLSDADGRDDEFACVRQSHGYGVGLSKKHCNADEEDSLFIIIPTGHGTYSLISSPYGELKADYPWISPRGSGTVEFQLQPY